MHGPSAARLRAICDLDVASAREYVGLHHYDGQVQDLSPAGVAAGLARLGGDPDPDRHDDAHLAAAEEGLRVWLGALEAHRWNPLLHVGNLDLSCYDREYAPTVERAEGRRRHLSAWPAAVDAAVEALDRVAAPVAEGLLGAVRGLAEGLDPADPTTGPALESHARLVAHVERLGADGDADAALGGTVLARLLSSAEALPVDLGRLARQADAERDRVRDLLDEACERLAPGQPPAQVVAALAADHPDAAGVLVAAREETERSIAFTVERDLVGGVDGECRVGPAPASRRWAMAMMSWAAPYEDDNPSWYHVTPPDPGWPREEQEGWLAVFNRAQLPAVTVHEVAPGHFAHGRALRRAPTDVRKTVTSEAFVEGWAHYAEELCLEEGYADGDPRFAVGVAVEALIRVTRLAVSVGVHTGAMTVDEATRRFEADGFLAGPAARSEALRATFDPTYGRYTWGKLELLALRDEARARWGARYSHRRFADALMALGAPPLGLLGDIF